MKKLWFFDLDGTLADTDRDIREDSAEGVLNVCFPSRSNVRGMSSLIIRSLANPAL